jgi:hypothetical protein
MGKSSGTDKASTGAGVGEDPLAKGGPQRYKILKFFVGSFGLDYIVLTDGRRVRNLGLTLLTIIGGPDY